MKASARLVATLAISAIALSACKEDSDPPKPGGPGVESGYAKGKVVDEAGNPVKDVVVIIPNMTQSNTAIEATSSADGSYRVELGTGIWRVSHGVLTKQFEGRTFELEVHSEDRGTFEAVQGAVRNLTWKLTGPKATNPSAHYGGTVHVFYTRGAINYEYVTFRFEPIQLIDGSKPAPFERKVLSGAARIEDVPLGKYKLTGTYQEPGGPLQTLDLRETANSEAAYVPELEVTFYPQVLNAENALKIDFI